MVSMLEELSMYRDQFLNSTISGPAGLHHLIWIEHILMKMGYVVALLLHVRLIRNLNQTFPGGNDKVIYVKGGPVRVHGVYSGRYTVVTDEFTEYRRHAWTGPNIPVDTIWNNIWITGDLINKDAIGYHQEHQFMYKMVTCLNGNQEMDAKVDLKI